MSDKFISKDQFMHMCMIGIGGILMIVGALIAGYNSSWWVTLGVILSVFGNDLMRAQRTIKSMEVILNGLIEIIGDEIDKRCK